MTLNDFRRRLDVVWNTTSTKVDWMSYEQFVRDVFASELFIEYKLFLLREALAAWTKRG